MKTLPLCCCLLLGLVACAAHEPPATPANELTLGKVQGEIKLGMSSAAVAEALGSPNIVTTDDQRREVWVYDKISTERLDVSRSGYGTLLLFGGGNRRDSSTTRQRTLTILVKFDGEQKVRDFAYNYTQF